MNFKPILIDIAKALKSGFIEFVLLTNKHFMYV